MFRDTLVVMIASLLIGGVADPVAWNYIGLCLAPAGASMACSIENTNEYKMVFSPLSGFNPGETSRTLFLSATLMSGGAAMVDDLLGVGIHVTYSDGSEGSSFFGSDQNSSGDLGGTVVPEPQTGNLFD